MYPGTKFNWYDNSQFSTTTAATGLDNAPLFLTSFSADKGTEDMVRLTGDDFYRMYGKSLSFSKHGQPLLQAGRLIDTGAELLCKRVVSDDATLSNLILCIELSEISTQKTDDEGHPIYIDNATGDETTEAQTGGIDNQPVMLVESKIKWVANTVANCKTFDEVKAAVEDLYSPFDDETGKGTYPIYIVTDIGRNKDCKAIRILPDYASSKNLGVMIYEMADIEGTDVVEKVTFTANSKIIINNVSYAVNDYMMGQLHVSEVDGMLEEYAAKLAEILGMETADIMKLDMLFGAAINGASLENVSIDADGVDITNEYGISLKSGSEGAENYFGSEEYNKAMIGFFLGEDTDAIFDVDVHKIRAVVDANYDFSVKEAITTLADFRQDFFFFRDLGVGLTTYNSIIEASNKLPKTKFAGDYMTSYKVLDPLTRKRIDVTMMYDFVEPLVNHFVNGAEVPLAGETNNFILRSAIPGTLNYTPVNTLRVNQKDLLDDARINYATYYEYGGNLVVESLYTSQDATTQLSYINNVLAIQEVMRALRSACPKNRFKFQSGNDFSDYEDACTEVLAAYKSWFSKLEFIYTQDDIRATQKIFYASINFAFNNWVQSEIFDLYALPTVTTENA